MKPAVVEPEKTHLQTYRQQLLQGLQATLAGRSRF